MPWTLLAGAVVLVCTSGWSLFRLYTDDSIRGKNLNGGRFLAMVPAFLAAGLVFIMISEYRQENEASQAVREHRCVWREGRIDHHSRPGELVHGSMGFTVNGEDFFYSDLSPGFRGPMCVAGAPCDGDYVRVCRFKATISPSKNARRPERLADGRTSRWGV